MSVELVGSLMMPENDFAEPAPPTSVAQSSGAEAKLESAVFPSSRKIVVVSIAPANVA